MRRLPQPLQRIIESDATLGAWEARRAREEALTGLVRRELPRQLGARLRVHETPAGDLELVTGAGAVAAALRQRLPDVAAALRRHGIDAAWRVRVALTAAPPEAPRHAPRALDRAAVAPLQDLARKLPAGPLRSAVARLLRRSGTGALDS